MEQKWSRTIILSLTLHVMVFAALLFVPDHMPVGKIRGPVYEVNLVDMPPARRLKTGKGSRTKTGKKKVINRKKTSRAKRISRPLKKEKAVVIAKRTLKKKKRKIKKTKKTSSGHVDKAIKKIEKRVKSKEKDPDRSIDLAIAKIEKRVRKESENSVDQAVSRIESRIKGGAGGGAYKGIGNRIYQVKIYERIKSNWSYPVAIASSKRDKNLEAVFVIRVRKDGTIMDHSFKKRSSNAIFDQSVLKAIEKSDPLPPFPPGYLKTYDSIEITFNLSNLQGR